MLFDALSKGEDITITYRGKPRAKLIAAEQHKNEKDSALFGIWRDDEEDVDAKVRKLREGRSFAL